MRFTTKAREPIQRSILLQYALKSVKIVIAQIFKKCARSVVLISTGKHLSLKIADIPVQVLYSTDGTNAQTNYVLFP